jgi:ribosome-binding protein aMBF1 (putative translation factor)
MQVPAAIDNPLASCDYWGEINRAVAADPTPVVVTMSQNEPRRVGLAEARAARAGRPEVSVAYEQARLRFELAEAVRSRREELGLSQRQLAERPG